MNEQVLEQVAKMLRAQLRSAGHLWWIGGYVYGVTGNNDPFIILYPADEKLHEKVVRVYPHDFKKLPAFIPTDVDSGDTEGNPNKEQARKTGIYHECPFFEVVTFDGKETQMGRERRFGDVLRLSSKARAAVVAAERGPQPERDAGQAQQAQQQRPSGPTPPPPDGASWTPPISTAGQRPGHVPAGTQEGKGTDGLPDYRAMAEKAKTAGEFDYAAYMVLRNGVYDSVERVTKTRANLVAEWTPSPAANRAALLALEMYRDKRAQAEADGAKPPAAHHTAKQEALKVFKVMIEE